MHLDLFTLRLLTVVAIMNISIVLGNEVHDFGKFPANVRKEFIFKITNQDKTPLILGKVHSTCGCMTGSLTKSRLNHGESAELCVILKENSISGPFSKDIYVETDRKNNRFLKLQVSGEAVPLVKVRPDSLLYIGNIPVEQESVFKFNLQPGSPDTPPLKFWIPAFPQSSHWQGDLSFDDQKRELTVKIRPLSKGNLLDVKFEVKILEPSGWAPIQFKLYGKTQ